MHLLNANLLSFLIVKKVSCPDQFFQWTHVGGEQTGTRLLMVVVLVVVVLVAGPVWCGISFVQGTNLEVDVRTDLEEEVLCLAPSSSTFLLDILSASAPPSLLWLLLALGISTDLDDETRLLAREDWETCLNGFFDVSSSLYGCETVAATAKCLFDVFFISDSWLYVLPLVFLGVIHLLSDFLLRRG